MAEASNVFELLQCGILLAYWVWDSFDTGRDSSSDCMLCGSHVVNMWLLVMNRTGPMSQLPAAKGRELPGGGPRRRSGLFTVCRGSRLLAVMNSSPFAT